MLTTSLSRSFFFLEVTKRLKKKKTPAVIPSFFTIAFFFWCVCVCASKHTSKRIPSFFFFQFHHVAFTEQAHLLPSLISLEIHLKKKKSGLKKKKRTTTTTTKRHSHTIEERDRFYIFYYLIPSPFRFSIHITSYKDRTRR